MKKHFYAILLVLCIGFQVTLQAQTINLNEQFIQQHLRVSQLLGEFDPSFSFTSLPIQTGTNGVKINPELLGGRTYGATLKTFWAKHGILKVLPVDFLMAYSSHHPYNRNNGSMIPNRGYQQLVSFGLYAEIGPLSIQFKPEAVYAENRAFEGFPDSHYPVIWARRYFFWNRIDLPERFGDHPYKKTLLGQSSIRLNYKGLSLGLSTENIWWGPGMRNSIMMSNQAQGFKHITFNSSRPLKTKIGSFEWQLVTGRLEGSGFTPPETDRSYAGTQLYVPKKDDWRYFQGFTFTYSPKWIEGLSLGLIRWIQEYHKLAFKNHDYFPIFNSIFRKKLDYSTLEGNLELNRDQAAGVFLRWLWPDAKAEIYGSFNFNDAKYNFRDLLLDTNHSRAATIGIHKVFQATPSRKTYEFTWEWTQMGQTGSRLLREAGAWYVHSNVRHGYTNNGEVLGAGIGPGSNAHFFELAMIDKGNRYGIGFEIIDQDNDFFYAAFEDSKDFRRYWKDFNMHLSVQKKVQHYWGTVNVVYSRSLNYEWELASFDTPYYHPGRDVNNLHIDFKLTYHFNFKK